MKYVEQNISDRCIEHDIYYKIYFTKCSYQNTFNKIHLLKCI